MDIRTGRQIFNSYWLIEAQSALGYLQMWEHYLQNGERWQPKAFEDNAEPRQTLNPRTKFFASDKIISAPIDAWSPEADAFNGFEGADVAVIPLDGPLMKADFCGWYGTASMLSFFQLAENTDSVKTIVLKIDSPGGTVDGTQAFADAVRASQKKTIAIVDNMMCSAAYWIGSSADEVIVTSNTDIVGSIGTMASWYDRTQFLDKNGIVLREYTATRSKDKNKAFNDANKGDGKLLVQTMLDPLNSEFLDAVTANRAGKIDLKTEDVLSGKTYTSKDALKFGLVDKIMPMNEAMNYAASTAQTKSPTQKLFNMKFPKLFSFLGFSTEEKEQDVKLETHGEKLEALATENETLKQENTDLETNAATLAGAITQLTTERDNATAKITEHEATISTLQTEASAATQTIAALSVDKTNLTAEVARLGAMDGKTFTTVAGEKDSIPNTDKDIDANEIAAQKELYARVNQ